jgi:hypothetical protein
MFQNLKPLFLIYLFFAGAPLFAQRFNGNSFYSGYGMGDPVAPGMVRNLGMGGTGVSHSHLEFINNLNPALLHADKYMNNDSLTRRYTLFDASMAITGRKSSTSLTSQNNYSANFNYFTWSVPMSAKWTTNIGLQPFTQVNYKVKYRNAVVGSPSTDSTIIRRNGLGGLYEIYWANGLDINRNLSVGLQMSYIFGNRTDAISHQLTQGGINQPDLFVYSNKINQHAVGIKPGIVFRKEFLKKYDKEILDRENSVYINFGATYELFATGIGKQEIKTQDQDTLGNVISSHVISSRTISLRVPSVLKTGLSFDKPRSWTLAADFTYTPWSYYQGYVLSDAPFNVKLGNSYTIALGGELHTKGAHLQKEEARRKILRAGLAYSKTPYIGTQAVQLNDFSASLGASIPIKLLKERTMRPLNKLNLALIVGQRGTTQNNQIKELYFKLYFGFIISEEWFHRSKID